MTKPLTPYQFFLEHAGYSYKPSEESHRQGRMRGARALAKAERQARQRGYCFQWSIDPAGSSSLGHTWVCCAIGPRDTEYKGAGEVLASLADIDFGCDGEPWGNPYRRVIEAELAQEALDRQEVEL